jgi:ribonuclease D
MVAWDLNEAMSKEQQTSNWAAAKLSKEQLDYAFLDAYKTFQLWQHWSSRASDHHWGGFSMLKWKTPV